MLRFEISKGGADAAGAAWTAAVRVVATRSNIRSILVVCVIE
jgi:hypothetical protein